MRPSAVTAALPRLDIVAAQLLDPADRPSARRSARSPRSARCCDRRRAEQVRERALHRRAAQPAEHDDELPQRRVRWLRAAASMTRCAPCAEIVRAHDVFDVRRAPPNIVAITALRSRSSASTTGPARTCSRSSAAASGATASSSPICPSASAACSPTRSSSSSGIRPRRHRRIADLRAARRARGTRGRSRAIRRSPPAARPRRGGASLPSASMA